MVSRPPALPPWVIVDRVAIVRTNAMVEEPEDAAPVVLRSDTTNEAEDAPAYITLAATRRVSRVTVPRSAHPHRGADYDKRSFIIVADPAGLVIHQYDAPAFGFNISDDLWGNLFMLLECSFVPIGSGELDMPTAILIPDYVEPAIQYICNIKNVRLISHPSSNGVDAEYIIVELWIGFSAEHVRLIYFRSSSPSWVMKDLDCHQMPGRTSTH